VRSTFASGLVEPNGSAFDAANNHFVASGANILNSCRTEWKVFLPPGQVVG
jgi:hypothetical protein